MVTSSTPTAYAPSIPTPAAKSVKPAAKVPAKTAKAAVKATVQSAKPKAAAPKPKAAPRPTKAPAPATTKDSKAKKPKLVRDSFTIPKDEYAVVETLKQRSAALAQPVKKSELLRAGLKVLAAMSDTALRAAVQAVPSIKTGRPKAEAADKAPAAASSAKPKISRK